MPCYGSRYKKSGKIHELAKGFSQVNTNDSQGLVLKDYTWGHYYVKSYNGISTYLLIVLLLLEDIGAVCDVQEEMMVLLDVDVTW
jgi:hypothetical protein